MGFVVPPNMEAGSSTRTQLSKRKPTVACGVRLGVAVSVGGAALVAVDASVGLAVVVGVSEAALVAEGARLSATTAGALGVSVRVAVITTAMGVKGSVTVGAFERLQAARRLTITMSINPAKKGVVFLMRDLILAVNRVGRNGAHDTTLGRGFL